MTTENQEVHTCVYCGQEAHYQFKNGKWCCTPKMSQCPSNKKRFSDKVKNAHEKRKELTGSAIFKKGQFLKDHKEVSIFWRTYLRPLRTIC